MNRGFERLILAARRLALILVVWVGVGSHAATLTRIDDAASAWNAPTVDVGAHGYVVEEFLLEGEATAYQLIGDRSRDGRWQTKPLAETAPFRSRILVVRPADGADFNGTVVVHWQNVTAGFDLGSVTGGEILNGYAWVGVSAQKVGVDGMGETPNGLRQSNPRRYGTLEHPGDGYSFDIFTQAGEALGPARQGAIDPMGGLPVERLIAAGASQSAHRLRTYINGVHQHEGVFDGYIPYIDFGGVTPFDSAPRSPGSGLREQASIRDDLDVPVIVVNSETETSFYFGVREDDTDKFRFWEVAGTSHVAAAEGQPSPGLSQPNWLSFGPVYDAAIHHLHGWITTGSAPPVLARIEVDAAAGMMPPVRRDDHGNAIGGIRLPEIEVPTAAHSGTGAMDGDNQFAFLYGKAVDLPMAQLRSMYPSRDDYLDRYEAALDRVIASGAVLSAAKDDRMRAASARFDRLLAH